GLLFETEEIEPYGDGGLIPEEPLPETASAIWYAMRAFFQAFPARAIYFVHEAWDLDILKYYSTHQGNLWLFDLALVPPTLFRHFPPMPSTYTSQELPYGCGLAQEKWQPILPWLMETRP